MPVLAGLAIPTTSPNVPAAEALIKYLTDPKVQVTTLREVGFFPVVDVDFPGFVSPGIKAEGEAVAAQSAAPDALPSLLPQGLGGKSGDFSKVYRDTFTRIVLNGEDIATVLNEQKVALQAIMDETGAPCWPPDPDSGGQPCQVK
jgi:multiple sugar transport system substrate-binding protein